MTTYTCAKGHELGEPPPPSGLEIVTNCADCDAVICLECGRAIAWGTSVTDKTAQAMLETWDIHYYGGDGEACP